MIFRNNPFPYRGGESVLEIKRWLCFVGSLHVTDGAEALKRK